MQDKTPSGGLKWVRKDILANLERVRRGVADDGDVADAVATLFEVRGILFALPLSTAAMLAEEMQRAAETLATTSMGEGGQVRVALARALQQLPDYLARVEAGAGEDPLALLPAINDLRGARGLTPMTAAELLLPASVLAQTERLSADALERLARIARKVRPHFHRYLVRWFGEADPDEGLIGLARLFNQMRRYFKDGPVHELFLAAEGVVEGLLTGAIVPDPPCKALLGRIDKVLKPLAAQPQPQWPEEVASLLLSDLLAQLAQMPPGSPVLQELERAYGRRLDADGGPPTEQSETATLIETLRHELLPIAALLGSELTPARAELTAIAVRLQRLGESFALIGQDALAARLARCADSLELLAGAATPDRGRLDDIARTLVQVDTELQALGDLSRALPVFEVSTSPRVRDLTAATLREARNELAAIRVSIGRAPSETDLARLASAAEALMALADAIGGVGEMDPARLLVALAEQLEARYLLTRQSPGEAGLELIGRVLAAVDIHLEDRLERDRVDPRMLGEASYAIERLAALLPAAQVADQDSETQSLSVTDASHSVNMEFLALFRDEAADELESIRADYQRWQADPQDDCALAALYRSFQALKGSGGLVGAQRLADLARLTALLLDRLLERVMPRDAAVVAFLDAVLAALPDVVEAEAARSRPAIAELMQQGHALVHASASATAAPRDAGAAGAGELGPESDVGVTVHPSILLPHADDLTMEPLTAVSPSQDFSFLPAQPQSAYHAPPAEGLLVETLDLDTSLRAAPADAPDGCLSFHTTVVEAGDEVAFLDDADLASVFVGEARDLLTALDDWLRAQRDQAFTEASLQVARRHLHTLKGSAHMAGLGPIGDLSHALESLLGRADPTRARPAAGGAATIPFALVQQTLDLLAEQVDALASERPMPLAPALIDALEAGATDQVLALDTAPTAAAETATGLLTAAAALPLRLPPEWLDAMINLAGEAGTYRARLVQANTRLGFRKTQLEESLKRLGRRLQRLGGELGGGGEPRGDDRAELYLGQGRDLVGEALRLLDVVGELQRDNVDLLGAQARITASMQDRLLETRMVAFARVEPRLQRLVRQAAASLGKDIELVIEGGGVELDRTVLERFLVPLEHLLRNAVAHGIEPVALRQARGKPGTGLVRVALTREGNDILFLIADDGAGMDPERIRTHARERGLIAPDTLLDDDAILALTLQPGFSTADTVTQLSGRGVGLDVVKAEITALNGEFNLTSRLGAGVEFRVRLPLTLSLVDALLITAGGNLFALPHGSLLAIGRIERARLADADSQHPVLVDYQGEAFRVVSLAGVLQDWQSADPAGRPAPQLPRRRWLPVLLAAAGGQRIAFQIDGLGGSQRVMVKPIGPPLGALRWLLGGTLLPDGRVALLLDLLALIRGGALAADGGLAPPVSARRLLAVDDSALVRRYARSLLGRADIKLLTASDEAEVDLLLRRDVPDLLLLDAGGEQVDGLALVRRIRGDARLRQVPIIMLFADDDETLRARALALGVDRCLTAPLDDPEFVTEIDAVLPPARA